MTDKTLLDYAKDYLNKHEDLDFVGRGANHGVWSTEKENAILHFHKQMGRKGGGWVKVTLFDLNHEGLELKIEYKLIGGSYEWETFFEGFVETYYDFDRLLVMMGLEETQIQEDTMEIKKTESGSILIEKDNDLIKLLPPRELVAKYDDSGNLEIIPVEQHLRDTISNLLRERGEILHTMMELFNQAVDYNEKTGHYCDMGIGIYEHVHDFLKEEGVIDEWRERYDIDYYD